MSHQHRGYAASARAAAQNAMFGDRSPEPVYQKPNTRNYFDNNSDVERSPEPLPPRSRLDSFSQSRHAAGSTQGTQQTSRAASFFFNFDADDTDSGSEDLEDLHQMRSAYSEPVLSLPEEFRSPPHRSQTFSHRDPQRRETSHHSHQKHAAQSLDSTEKEALLDRVRQLSAREAETAAALARATAQNAALTDEIDHWRAVAKESAASRRAAREALSEISAENARLAAAYSAQRIEVAALQDALQHERAQAGARVAELERSLHAMRSDYAKSSLGGHEQQQQQHRPSSHPNSTTAADGSWDQERQDLLSLLERLQEQLAAHAAQQHEEQGNQQQQRPSSGHRHRAQPARPASTAAAYYRDQKEQEEHSAGSDEDLEYEVRPPASTPARAKRAPTPQKPSPLQKENHSAAGAKTPATGEPVGLRYESSFESTTTGFAPPSSHAKQSPATARKTPMAQTPPLSATRPSSSDQRAMRTPQPHSVPTASPLPTPSPPRSTAQEKPKTVIELKAAADRLVRHKKYLEAVQQYSAAISIAENAGDISAVVVLLCSRAAACAAMGQLLESAADCCRAEKLSPDGCARAIDLRAEAFCVMGAFDLAAEDLSRLKHRSNTSGGSSPAVAARLQDARRAAAEGGPRNHYAVLGVKSGATSAEIKSAYKALALRLHPDKASDALGHDSATTLFSFLSAAHGTLSNTQSRRAYDLQLLSHKYNSGSSTSTAASPFSSYHDVGAASSMRRTSSASASSGFGASWR